jgi:hypothetical protein
MTYEEIKLKLKEVGLTPQHFGVFSYSGECVMYDEETGDEIEYDIMGILKDNFGEVVVAETSYFHDGYECWAVYHLKDHNVYLRFKGYFSSYDSTEWSGGKEVFPEEKTIIVYNEKKKEN